MSKRTDYTERELLELIRRGTSDSDPVPPDVTEFAAAAFSWRNIDAELAAMAFDSADEDLPAGVRSSGAERSLSFESPTISIDIEYRAATRRVIGQVSPPQVATVELHHREGTVTTETDDLGRFSFDGLEPGPVSVVIRTQGDTPEVVKTEWTVL
jgi:hypothetical protein